MDEIKVYVKVDNNNIIKEINSSIFIKDLTGWIEIDEGQGNKYSHAQSQYLPKGLLDMHMHYNYKLVNGKVVELTDAEKATLFPTPKPQPTTEEKLEATQKELEETKAQLEITQKALNGILI